MKRLFACLLFLVILLNARATESCSYYIYVQMEYTQGSWIRADQLLKSNYRYLHPKLFEELFGSEDMDFVQAVFRHLRLENAHRYGFKSDLSLSRDTVVIQTAAEIPEFEAVKNELVASYLLNGFAALKWMRKDQIAIYGLKDISVPYMDLVMPRQKDSPDKRSPNHDSLAPQTDSSGGNEMDSREGHKSRTWSLFTWPLVFSVLLNFLLFMFIVFKKPNPKS